LFTALFQLCREAQFWHAAKEEMYSPLQLQMRIIAKGDVPNA
jgi:hypothetical protein